MLRTDLSGDPPSASCWRGCARTALGAYAHQDLPFEKLVEELQPERDLSHTPLFQVMFVLQNAPLATGCWGCGGSRASAGDGHGTAKFDLTLALRETAAAPTAGLEYNTDLFDAATVERMLGHLRPARRGGGADPDRRARPSCRCSPRRSARR